MRKRIYSNYRTDSVSEAEIIHGLFDREKFREYMSSEGAEKVNFIEIPELHLLNESEYPRLHSQTGLNYVETYHIEPQGVTVRHASKEIYAQSLLIEYVSVSLFGSKSGIGEVEKKILKDAKDFKKSHTKN